MMGQGKDHVVSNSWPELLPTDGLQEAQTSAAHVELGASRAGQLRKLGYDPDVEVQLKEEFDDKLKPPAVLSPVVGDNPPAFG
jgi:hypothetical protein